MSGAITVPATGGWDAWETVSTTGISVDAGQQVVRVAMDESWWDLNYLDFSLDGGSDDGGDTAGTGGDSLVAEIDPSTTSAGVGDLGEFHVSDTSASDTWITSLEWKISNGTTGTGWYMTHRFQSTGSYTVTLTATDRGWVELWLFAQSHERVQGVLTRVARSCGLKICHLPDLNR